LYILVLYTFCASGFTLAKGALVATTPFFFVAVRLLIAGGGMLTWFFLRGHTAPILTRRSLFYLAQLSVLATYLAFMCDLWSLQFFTSAESAFIFNFTPFITAIFSRVWFKERLTARKLLGMGLGFSAALLLIGSMPRFSGQLVFSLPFFALCVAVILGAYGWIAMRVLMQEERLPISFVNGTSMLIAGFLALVSSYTAEIAFWQPLPIFQPQLFVMVTVSAVVLVNICFTNLYSYLLRRYTFMCWAHLPLYCELLW
ncbi:MAG: hypothetical protein UV79_C0003G0001, partial [candidate division TM6 bacterium GW2011_GWF2_43_17]